MTERLFLAVVGVAYIVLAVWCSLRPGQTSQSVGFTLTPGSGQSEYLVVYGGLELGLGIVFLLPLYKPEQAQFVLAVCLIIHAWSSFARSVFFSTVASAARPMFLRWSSGLSFCLHCC